MSLSPGGRPSDERSSDEVRAWAALTANLLVLPGLGTLLARRYALGGAQCALALAGFAQTVVWLWRVVGEMRAAGTPFLDPPPSLLPAFSGLLVFGAAWLWAAATSRAIVRAAGRRR